MSNIYIQIPPDRLVGLIYQSTTVATVSLRTLKGTLKLLQSTLKGTLTCSGHGSTTLYEIYIAGGINLDV